MTKEELQKEIELTVAELPLCPTPEQDEKFLSMPKEMFLYKTDYIIDPLTNMQRKMAKCHCSACGEDIWLEQVFYSSGCHNGERKIGFVDCNTGAEIFSFKTLQCPCCGAEVEAIHCSYCRYSYQINFKAFLSICNVRGHLCLLEFGKEKRLSQEGKTFYLYRLVDGVIIIGKRFVKVAGYCKFMSSYSWYSNWEARAKFYDTLLDYYKGTIDYESDYAKTSLYSSEYANSGLLEYINACKDSCSLVTYLRLYSKYPNVENLVKQGYGKFIAPVLATSDYKRYGDCEKQIKEFVNFKESKPHMMLGLEKHELYLAQLFPITVVDAYRYFKNKGYKLNIEQLTFLEMHSFKLRDISDFLLKKFYGYKIPVIKTFNYVIKQYKLHGCKNLINFRYLKDYWEAIYNVYGDMPKDILYPKNLVYAHDTMIMRVAEKVNPKYDCAMRSLQYKRNQYSFIDYELGLMIYACSSHQALIKEGKLLSHCVANYAGEHSQEKTNILFIRKIDEPLVPYYTLEYKNGSIIQNRGYKNDMNGTVAKPEAVILFQARWLEHMKKIEEEFKNGKRFRNSREHLEALRAARVGA